MTSQNLVTCSVCGGENLEENMRFDIIKDGAICEFCLLEPDAPIPFRPAEMTVEQRLALFCEPDEGLAQIVAANSGRDGDRLFAVAATAELQRRNELKQALSQLNQNGRMSGPREAD